MNNRLSIVVKRVGNSDTTYTTYTTYTAIPKALLSKVGSVMNRSYPTVTAGMSLKADYIDRYNGNYARWAGLLPLVQENYRKQLKGISDKFVRELAIEYNKEQIKNKKE